MVDWTYSMQVLRLAFSWNIQGKGKRGCPVKTWRKILDSEMKTTGIDREKAIDGPVGGQ